MLKRLFLALALILTLAGDALATTYYTKKTGNDSNSGLDLGNAFLTIGKGLSMLTTCGDQLLIDDGTYDEVVSIQAKTGCAESPKAITAITQATPAVVTSAGHGYSNGDIVQILGVTNAVTTGMPQLFSKFFKVANAAADTFELTTVVDGANVDSRTYYPYVGSGTVTRIQPFIIRAINRGLVIVDTSETVSGWVDIGSGKYTSDAVTLNSGSSSPILWRTDQTSAAAGYKSSCASVTSEGNYCYDTSTSKFTLKTSVSPSGYTYKAFRRGNQTNIAIKNVKYVLIDGIKTQYGSDPLFVQSSTGETGHVVMDYMTTSKTVYHGGTFIYGDDAYQCHHIVLDHSTVEYQDDNGTGIDSNGHGIKIGGASNTSNQQYITVSNSTIYNTRQHGIQFSNGVTSGYFYGNRIYNYSLSSSGAAAGIRTGQGETNHLSNKDTQIFQNDIGNGSGGTGYAQGCSIFVQDDNANTAIFDNLIHHNLWHGIYVFYTGGAIAPSYAKIFNNLIYENRTAGVRSDNSYGGVNGNNKLYNNTFYLNGEASIYGVGAAISLPQAYSDGWAIYNNIIDSTNAYLIYSSTSGHIYPSNYNLFYSSVGYKWFFNGTTYTTLAGWTAATTGVAPPTGLDYNSVYGDPLFGAPSSYDFTIPSPDTPADAIGTDLSATIPYDHSLEARQVPFDAGAYNTRGNLIIQPSVSPSSVFPNRVTTDTVSFRLTQVDLLKNDKIKVTFPAGFVINSGGTTGVTSVSGIDGTYTVSVASQVVTVARNNDGTDKSPATFSFGLTFIQNPGTSGPTGKFGIEVTDSGGTQKANNSNVPYVIISDVAPGTISGGVMQGGTLS